MSKLPADLHTASLQVHADDYLAHELGTDVAAPINVTTTFRYPSDSSKFVTATELEEKLQSLEIESKDIPHIYSRYTQPVSTRAEAVLSSITGGYAVLYSSGLSSFHAAMIHYNPKNVFIGKAYHGCLGILDILTRNYNVKVHSLDDLQFLGEDGVSTKDPSVKLTPGDVVHLETPINPTGIAHDIVYYADIAHKYNAKLVVDATFAPPPLQDPFKFGADLIMHSATKYFGGHSDLLAGVLVTQDKKVEDQLKHDRNYIGTITASLESWFLLRSLRTYDMRIRRQAESANKIVKYFNENKEKFPVLKKIYHASLQILQAEEEEKQGKTSDFAFVKEQLPLGGGPVFSIEVENEQVAKNLPAKTALFHHATSLGGVESLIEWRAMSDPHIQRNLLRISIGVEDADDLIKDLSNAFSRSA